MYGEDTLLQVPWSLASTLNWSMQVSEFEVCKKASQQVGILYRNKFYPPANTTSLLQL